MEVDRRAVLQQLSMLLAGLGGAAALSACKTKTKSRPDTGEAKAKPSVDAGVKTEEVKRALKPRQRKTLEAAVARVLPSDHEPGAREANVIEYIDRELAYPQYEDLRKLLMGGVVAMNRSAMRQAKKPFFELEEAEQDDILREVESLGRTGRSVIQILVALTVEGFLGDPRWGGNKGGVGWKLIGYGPGTVDGTVTRCNDDQ